MEFATALSLQQSVGINPMIGESPRALKNMVQQHIAPYGVQANNHTNISTPDILASLLSISIYNNIINILIIVYIYSN